MITTYAPSNSWAKIIMLYCPDEKQGFERFFQLLEEFQQQAIDVRADGVKETEVIQSLADSSVA